MRLHNIITCLLFAYSFVSSAPDTQAADDPNGVILPPKHVMAGGKPVDVGRYGYAAPYMADLDGKGVPDLIVGEFSLGRVRVYKNHGTPGKPKFDTHETIMASGVPAETEAGCWLGFTPQIADFFGTGRGDLITGSKPGRLYSFRRNPDGTFASRELIKDAGLSALDAGSMTCVFVCDWFGTGKMDLIVGTVQGTVTVCRHAGGSGKEPKYGPPQTLTLKDGSPLQIPSGDAAPCVADWDGDGLPDLIVGAADGSVVWFRNVGDRKAPKFEPARELVPISNVVRFNNLVAGEWGTKAKPCVVDWDGDGRLDLLVGDRNSGFEGKPDQTVEEKAEEKSVHGALPKLRDQWADALKEYREAQVATDGETAKAKSDRLERVETLRRKVVRLKGEIAAVQDVQQRYQQSSQTHGYVWLFMRQPAATSTTTTKTKLTKEK